MALAGCLPLCPWLAPSGDRTCFAPTPCPLSPPSQLCVSPAWGWGTAQLAGTRLQEEAGLLQPNLGQDPAACSVLAAGRAALSQVRAGMCLQEGMETEAAVWSGCEQLRSSSSEEPLGLGWLLLMLSSLPGRAFGHQPLPALLWSPWIPGIPLPAPGRVSRPALHRGQGCALLPAPGRGQCRCQRGELGAAEHPGLSGLILFPHGPVSAQLSRAKSL